MVLGRLAYLLGVLGLGYLASRGGLLTDDWIDRLNAAAFYVALPAVVFTATYDQSLARIVSPVLVVGLWAVLLATAGLAWLVHRRAESRARWSVAVVQSYHGNLGYLGVPLVLSTFGERAGAVASVVLGVVVIVQTPLTIVLLIRLNDADAAVRDELVSLARNPVLGALVFGLFVSVVDLSVPGLVATALGSIAELALPLALVLVGASLTFELSALDLPRTGSVVALKVVVMPLLAAVVFTVLDVPRATFLAAVAMFAMPTAISTYVYTAELGGDAQFASINVFSTTGAGLPLVVLALQAV